MSAVTLNKQSDKSPHGGHDSRSFYTKTATGEVPENVLMHRRHKNGARVTKDWAYYLRNNDCRELWAFYGDSLYR